MPDPAPLTAALDSLAAHAERLKSSQLAELWRDEARNGALRHRVGELLLDLSRQRLDLPALADLGAFLESTHWQEARDAMFGGAPVNRSERRPALHTALRGGSSHLPPLAPREVRQEIEYTLQRIERLVQAVHQGEAASLGLPATITDVVNIGIGGSDLGPRLALKALSSYRQPHLRSHFLANTDGRAVYDLMAHLNPKRCLVVIVSKSFDTQETLLNAEAIRDWIARAQDSDPASTAKRFLTVTAHPEAALRWGIAESNIYPLWDYVSGRTSLWSAAGLSLALLVGMEPFRQLLAGAAQLDDHFRLAPWSQNLPVLLALTELWNRNLQGYTSRAVVPYADRLAELPAYVQQLEMESLSKQVGNDGQAVPCATGGVVWGSVGSNAEHAYFQALNQGSEVVPVEFIGVVKPAHPLRSHHDALLAHLLAQATSLALGKSRAEARQEERHQREDPEATETLAAQRSLPGNRPSTVILLDALTPRALGNLIALYEHKVFLLAHLWGINAYDQWGLDLGKQLARKMLPMLDGEAADLASLDPPTRALIEEIQALREG